MKFVIQWNLMNEEALQKIKSAVEKYPHEYIEMIPFSRDINPEQTTKDIIPYGSTLLTTYAYEHGWTGLSFDLSKFNYEEACNNREDMLNDCSVDSLDSIVDLLTIFSDEDQKWFIRPSEDLKQFSGQVMTAKEIIEFLIDARECASSGSYHLSGDTKIVLTEPQEIQAEWRWFIVGGKVVSGSMYRAHGQMRQIRETDVNVIAEAQRFADLWLPAPNCVMDLALVGDELKVIEFNCINASGFYDSDVEAIIDSLWVYYDEH